MFNRIKILVNDTLKKKTEDGSLRWSRTSLIMFSSWISAISMAVYDYIQNGFDFKVFVVFVGTAISTKFADALGTAVINLTSK